MATGFDLFGIFLLVIMAVNGLRKGLIDGVLKIVGMYAAIYASMNYSEFGVVLIQQFIDIPENYQTIAGFGIVFLGTMYSITILGYILKKIVKTMNLGMVDRIGGVTFGAVKAGVLLSAVVWAYAMVPADMRGTWQEESKLYPSVEFFADNLIKLFAMEDELALMQSTVGSLMGQGTDGLIDKAMGGVGNGSLNPEILKALGGSEGEDELEVVERAMENMSGPQKGLLEKAMQQMGAGGSASDSGMSLIDELKKSMNASSSRESEMEKLMDELENKAQSRKK